MNNNTYIDSKGQLTVMDFDINVKAVLNQFYLGVGPSSIARCASMLDLPNAKSMLNHCNRRQGVIGDKLRSITLVAMDAAIEVEVKQTLIHEHDEKYYNNWKKNYRSRTCWTYRLI